MNEESQLPPPALPRRLVAMLYDTFLVLPLIMMTVALGLGTYSMLSGREDALLNPHITQMLAMACLVAFFSAFWLKGGQTLGMQAWRIKLVCSDGGTLSFHHCVIRCLAASFSAGLLGLGYLWCLVDPKKRYWHDYLSRTELVLLPKKEKAGTVSENGSA